MSDKYSNIAAKLVRIKEGFLANLESICLNRDKSIKKVVDNYKLNNIRKTLK